jgi:hypothetical protein
VKRAPKLLEWQEEAILSDVLDLSGIGHAHIPNEREAAKLGRVKAQGLHPGMPDHLIFPSPPKRPDIRCVWVELKRIGGGPPTKPQFECHLELEQLGDFVIVAYGADDAIGQLKDLGYPIRV